MLIVMKKDATQAQIDHVSQSVIDQGFEAHPMPGAQCTAICVLKNKGAVDENIFSNLPGVREVIRVTKPYKLASIETHPDPTIVEVCGEKIGADNFTVMAGPCSVETEESMFRNADKLASMDVKFFRAGAYKPRTGPYSFQGLGEEGLRILEKVRERTGMGIVTEVMDVETLPLVADSADILQVGTRNMSNTSLLKQLGKIDKPVLLKRGMSASLEELLLAAEYILSGGNHNVMLCERGIRTFSNHSRNTLDVAAVPALRALTHLPIIVDPSHAAGYTYMVPSLCLAGVAAGAHGLIVEAHDDASNAYSDGQQALHPEDMEKLLVQFNMIHKAVNL